MIDTQMNRRDLMKTLGIGGAALASGALMGGATELGSFFESEAEAASITDTDILNFALNLEYLESEFYAFTTTGMGIPTSLTGGVGKHGLTTGGSITNFVDTTLQAVALDIADDELNHVKYLRKALGHKAVAKPAITLDPLGATDTEAAFLTYSRAFEDTGVSAYGGAASLIRSKAILSSAARILATEAYHAGNIRLYVVQKGLTLSKLDKKDVVPTTTTFFATDSHGLAIVRSVAEVLKIVKPFFPNGLNGLIK